MHNSSSRPPLPLSLWFGTPRVPDFVRALEAAGGEVYVVGGAVRDWLADRPGSDVDLLVRALAPEVLTKTMRTFGTVALVGQRFGVYTCRIAATGRTYEIALPRTDASFGSGGYRDVTAHVAIDLPLVADMQRRDFTINAMAYRLTTKEVCDPCDGQADLSAKKLRAVGDPATRFAEDYTRMLRALRFATTTGMSIETKTAAALKKQMPHLADMRDGKWVVAREMVVAELTKALCADPARACSLASQYGVWETIVPGHAAHFLHARTQKMIALLSTKAFFQVHTSWSPLLVWSVLLAQASATVRKQFFATMPLATVGVVPSSVEQLCARMHELLQEEFPQPTLLERYFYADRLLGEELRALLWLFVESAPVGPRASLRIHYQDLLTLLDMLPKAKKGGGLVAPLLSGDEIQALLPLVSGPKIGTLLAQLRDAQLFGTISTKAQAKTFVRTYA